MKSSDRAILMVLPVVALLAAVYLLLIGPKRSEIKELDEQIAAAQTALEASQLEIAAGELAREEFAPSYARVVELGKAAPADGGQSTMLYDLAELGKKNDVKFIKFAVSSTSQNTGPTEPLPAAAGATPGAETPDAGAPAAPPAPGAEATPAATAETAPATEADAALLPLGATVGAAGLPVIPYTFTFSDGNFFEIADFFADIDSLVTTNRSGTPEVDGRLLTIDSFELTDDKAKGFPELKAIFNVTAYALPKQEGLVAGATPAGPPPGGLQVTSAGETP